MDNIFATDIDRVCDLVNQGYYDFIVVGSGLAGGTLTRELVENKKRVLLIEKGGVIFSTHCLNTSRPHWETYSTEGPTQDNDIVYGVVKQNVVTAPGSDVYVGGPVYCLGGRSTVWGLYSPALTEKKHQTFFPEEISDYLKNNGYEKAFGLFTNESQNYDHVYPRDDMKPSVKEAEETTEKQLQNAVEAFYESIGKQSHQTFFPQEISDYLENDGYKKAFGLEPSVKEAAETTKDQLQNAVKAFYESLGKQSHRVDLSPMASEFKSKKLYNFPQGAYSTVDYLLDRTYKRDPNLTLLLNTEVLTVSKDANTGQLTLEVRRTSDHKVYRLSAKTVVLSAGTIGTARIALSSGLQRQIPLVGKGLTDHDIWGVRFHIMTQELKEPIKFQCRLLIGGEDALLNVAINANSFLAREFSSSQFYSADGKLINRPPSAGEKYDTVNITIETQAKLIDSNEVF